MDLKKKQGLTLFATPHSSLQGSPYSLTNLRIRKHVRIPLANAAGNPQAGGDGGQDGRNGLNDEFPSFLFHVVH